MVSMSSWILSMKVILISAGVLSLATVLKFSVPVAVSGAPAAWSFLLSWLKPPYLYLIINGIILTIAVTSRFHHHGQPAEPSSPSAAVRSHHLISVKTPPPSIYVSSFSVQSDISTAAEDPSPAPAPAEAVVPEVEDDTEVVELKPVIVNGSMVDIETDEEIVASNEGEDVFIESTFAYNTTLPEEIISPEVQLQFPLPAREKPLVSSRFGHRKPNRSNPEGVRALRVARPKRQETLESTWKMITEGRHVPITRHLKKSDTWEHHADPTTVDHVLKSETFKDRSNYEAPAPAKTIRKEASLSQDELNRRVEAFINKFNEEMRMQRQESLNQYKEMMNGGA
ncbi:hypothetical protein ABFS82_13G113100 [Erythranthe guttata]|uniref:DUF4408 domain-containing protein n=1 Tax=Erythranthe guttata TaxID=4155 RepID=A0A022QN65_ERYGU|nr:PREDICTED: uncharacterized protein LOC105968434 [Erythranthe guttata]EYU27910.1 hypothetical protein MIMGU_mgv1a009532mg [Erythranthe guttata]|eukprot:XP_012848521.1 PREDICTED: uncharacterized protein LOC105968434 [Erythranthe guttata]